MIKGVIMGWPKKNEELRLYFERKNKTFLLIDINNICPDGSYEAIGELMLDPDPTRPCLCSTSVSPIHLYRKCRRASWDEMPDIWKKTMKEWIVKEPEQYRGLWKIGRRNG